MARTFLILFVVAGLLMAPDDVSSCGPFFPEALFSARNRPFDEARYYSGHLDILQPRYQRIYQVAAYRWLAGLGLTAADQAALTAPPAPPDQGPYLNAAIQAWLHARVLVGAPALDHIEHYKMYGPLAYIVNCGDDAFQHAAATLGQHFQAGLNHDELRAWVAAQDDVFTNCGAPPGTAAQIPPPAAVGAPGWMEADRAYQIAAAKFYAGDFDASAAEFERIAADAASPWHGIAAYLAARALIRKTTLVDATAAPAAHAQLEKVLADPAAAPWHDSARGLMRYLQVETDPPAAFNAVAQELETQRANVAQTMHDYCLLSDHFSNHAQNPPQDADITDWIDTPIGPDPGAHALERWRATHSLPWLVWAVAFADTPNPDIMAAVARIPESSPAYLTVQFHRLRLLPADEAGPQIEAMIARKLPVYASNLFRAERMRIARDWEDWLPYAARTEAGTFTGGFQELPPGPPGKYFDDDGARILDRQATLADLRHAAQSPSLPANLQFEVARVAWVRSIMLNDPGSAREIAPVLASLAPYLKPYLDLYVAAKEEPARAFAAAWLLLNNPGMGASIVAGFGRPTATPRIDDFRDNWWCPRLTGQRLNASMELLYQGADPEAAFLSSTERADAQKEQKLIDAFPAAPTFMSRQAVEWADAHPDDARVPEALRLAVRAGHLACAGDAQTDRWSKRAFDLLHARYGHTEAARRTPFWYKASVR
jgi:hypothetical protein